MSLFGRRERKPYQSPRATTAIVSTGVREFIRSRARITSIPNGASFEFRWPALLPRFFRGLYPKEPRIHIDRLPHQ